MSDLSIQGEVVVNSEKAESAFDRVGDKASQMANEVATSAGKAGQAVDKIGDGAGASAEKFTRAESRISASIKRATNELELLGKTASQRLEFNIADKGLDAAKFEPALKKLREIEAQALQAQRAASGSLDKMGISAAQTAAALRGVPAQFTDIVTSLQGGQAPLTVFLQQGGQLKDMFGGAGNAARALGGYVVGLINPFTLAAAAVGGLAFAYNQGSKEADAYRAALVTTGNAAGTNAAQLKSYAQEISSVVGTQGKAAEALSALAATGKVGAENLRDAAQAAVAYERATGQAASKTAEQFAALRNEPLSAVLKLNEGMNFLTESTYRQIKSLEEQGKTAEAANVAQRAFADTLSGRAGEMERNLGTVERGWLAVKDAAKGAWDAILNVGRSATNVDQLAEVRKQIAQRENQLANGGFGTNEGGAAFGRPSQAATERLRAELQVLQAKAAALEGVAYATKVAADEERKRGESVKASAAFDKAGEKFLTDKARMERELAAARVQGAEAGRSQAEIEKRLGEIRASYAKKGGSSVATENKDLRDQQRIFAELADVSSTYYSELAAAQEQRAKGNIGEAQYIAYVNDLIQKQPFAVALAKDEAAANVALSKAYAEAAAERIKTIQSMERAADGLQSQNDALREEIELIGLSNEQQTLVLQQRNEVIILTKEATLAELERQSAITGTQTRVEIALAAEIEALKERNALLGEKGAKNASVDAAKKAKDEWEKTTDQINQSLTDALLRGFESGKDFAKNLRDTVVNMFKTMVLRPVISAIVNPVAGAITGAMGLSGAAQAGQGISALGAAGNVASIAGGIGSVTTAGMLPGAMATALTGSTSSLAMGLSGAWGAGGGMLSTLNAGFSMLGSGSIMSGLGTLAGALGPIAIGIAALAAIFGKKATPHAGAASTYSEAGGLVSNTDIYQAVGFRDTRTYNAGVEQVTGNVAKAIGDTLNATAKAFGKTAGYEITTAFADDTSKDGAWGSLIIKQDGKSVLDWRDTKTSKWAPREFADGEAGSKEYMAAIAVSARDALVQAIGGVDWATDMLKALGDSPTLESLAGAVTQINAAKVALVQLGRDLVGFGDLTDGAISKLVKSAGGMDSLLTSARSYYLNYYTEGERAANTTRDIAAALADVGLEMPTTIEGFRALVERQQSLGEAGMDSVAVLFRVSEAFKSVTAESETAADAAARLADEQGKAAEAAARAAEKAAEDAARAYEKTLAYLTKTAETAMKILGAAVDREKQTQNAGYEAQIAIIDAQRKAATTAMDAQRVWMGVAIGGAQNYAKALESEAARIRGFFTGMVLQDNPDAPAGASVFAAQAALRAGDKSDAVLRKATDIDPEMFASWADYAVNFFETQGLVRGATQDAERAASVAASDVALLEQQLTLAEDKYKADLEHYTKLEGIAKETLDSNLLRLDALVQSAQDQLAEATGTKLAVMTIAQAMGNFSGSIGKLAWFTGNAITTPLPTAPVLTPFGAQTPETTIAPVAYSPVAYGGSGAASSNDRVVAALQDVLAELQAMRATGADTKAAVEKTSAILDQVTAGGNAMLTETA